MSEALPGLEAWQARGEKRSVLGRSIFRIAEGTSTRTAVVLVHGFPTSSLDWARVLPLLAETRRVLAIDLLGFGLSDKPWPHDYTIGEQVDLVEAWLAQEGIVRAHVLAHDMGDTVVQELLARRQEGRAGFAPASIVLLNGGLLVERIRPILAQRVLRLRRLGPLAARFLGRRSFGRSLTRIAGKKPGADELDALFALLERDGGRRVLPGLIRYMDERSQKRVRWRRATLEHAIPLKLVWGDRDPISPPSIAEEVKACRPATEVVRLPATGHYPQLEEPERVAAEALAWFERHEGVGPIILSEPARSAGESKDSAPPGPRSG